MARQTSVPRTPFTRLPADQTSSDLYDKTASIAANTDTNEATIAEHKQAADSAFADVNSQIGVLKKAPAFNQQSVLSVRRVTQSAYMQAEDYTVVFLITAAAICTLPNCRQASGQVFCVKSDAASTNTLTLNSQGNETIDGAAASSVTLAAGKAIMLQSDGFNWVILSRIP